MREARRADELRTSSTERGRDELVLVGQVDPVEAGADDRGDEMRTCTSAAPESKSIATSCCVVLPRTIESSTATTRFPNTRRAG